MNDIVQGLPNIWGNVLDHDPDVTTCVEEMHQTDLLCQNNMSMADNSFACLKGVMPMPPIMA